MGETGRHKHLWIKQCSRFGQKQQNRQKGRVMAKNNIDKNILT